MRHPLPRKMCLSIIENNGIGSCSVQASSQLSWYLSISKYTTNILLLLHSPAILSYRLNLLRLEIEINSSEKIVTQYCETRINILFWDSYCHFYLHGKI